MVNLKRRWRMFPQISKMSKDKVSPKTNDRQTYFRIAAEPEKPPGNEENLISSAPIIRKQNNQKCIRIGQCAPNRNVWNPIAPRLRTSVEKPVSHSITIQPFAVSPVLNPSIPHPLQQSISDNTAGSICITSCCSVWLWRHYIRGFFICPAFFDKFFGFVNCWQMVVWKFDQIFLQSCERFRFFIVPFIFHKKIYTNLALKFYCCFFQKIGRDP